MTKRLAIFAGYDGKGRIHDYVVYYLKELKKVADIVFVSDNHFSPDALSPIQDLILHSICLPHGEYDFGSYKRGYLWAKENGLLDKYDSLIFCNDSVFGPFRPLEPIFEQFEQKVKIDFWGMFCHHGSRTPLHIQSYFTVFKKQVFNSAAFFHFISSTKDDLNKSYIVRQYEVGLSQMLSKKGFKAEGLFLSAKNKPNDLHALKLIRSGFPFLKKSLFNPDSSCYLGNIDYTKALRQISSDYKTELISSYLQEHFPAKASQSSFLIIASRRLTRFLYQKKIDRHGKMIIKICKLQIYKGRQNRRQTDMPCGIFVSVVMPVYNGADHLRETVESILGQSYEHFEFLIADDCSTDNSYEILEEYARQDSRIKLFRTPENFGNPGGTSAFGISHVSKDVKYIVMTDQDDISVKDRLKFQIQFMEQHPIVEMSGGQMKMFGAKSRTTHPPQEDEAIKSRLLTSSPISNPTLIIRKSFLDESSLNYENQTSHDYRLLAEAALEHKACFYNMDTVLLHYRCHDQQTSIQKKNAIRQTSDQVRAWQLQKLGITRQADIDFFNAWKAKETEATDENLKRLKVLFETIIASNLSLQLYPHRELTQRLSYLYKKELLKSRNLSNIIHAIDFKFTKACHLETLNNS